MFKTAALAVVTLAVALGGGVASAWWALGSVDGLGALRVGVWTAYPDTGTERTDPYSAARAAREAELPLGPSEGLEFTAHRDSSGALLDRRCAYRVAGPSPAARFFTLYAADPERRPIRGRAGRAVGLASPDLLRPADDRVTIAVGPVPAAGNWLAVSGAGTMHLVLTLYDTPVASAARIGEIALPEILSDGCPS